MEKITYQMRGFRLAERVYKQLKDGKKEFGKTWNLYFAQLLKDTAHKAKKYDKQ